MNRACVITTFVLLLALDAVAATLCGTVSNADTGAPISGALVVLLDEFGASTGLSTGTATDGNWCLDDVAPGTYSIVVERDDYRLARVDNVVVNDTPTDVSIGALTNVLFAPIAPNPVSDRASLRWRVPEGAAFTLEVFDVRGRLLTGWSGTSRGDDTSLVWDLRDRDGRALSAGTYFARLRAEGSIAVQRMTVLR
jgi:hypothetical protein